MGKQNNFGSNFYVSTNRMNPSKVLFAGLLSNNTLEISGHDKDYDGAVVLVRKIGEYSMFVPTTATHFYVEVGTY